MCYSKIQLHGQSEDGEQSEEQDGALSVTPTSPLLHRSSAMEVNPTPLLRRQIWVDPSPTSSSVPRSCRPYKLPSGGEINIGKGTIITLSQDAAFQPPCSKTSAPPPIDPLQTGVDLSVLDAQRNPFYSSTNPQVYAIAAVTVVSYMLLIILFITPRTFFVGGTGGGGNFLGQRGMISGVHGNNSVIGIGGRPWLQKLAALTVAVSLTIVTADTFKWAHRQYDAGYEDATELSIIVINGLEVRIVRTISETCLWLAQAQTLIRLFPRHKEKLAIKWIAFAMIILELIFSSINHFAYEGAGHRSREFLDAIPALDYLFALALNMCYGAFVIYYTLCKRRFAFFHPQMRNMPLVALLSLTAVLIPVIFFIIDLSQPDISGWGSYVRWVGAAAASVVVWEWVERIEALEREEKKDGILGREIFDGDEMLEATTSSEINWPSSNKKDERGNRLSRNFGRGMSNTWGGVTTQVKQLGRSWQSHHEPSPSHPRKRNIPGRNSSILLLNGERNMRSHQNDHPTPPLPVASPVSRADTTSAASTVYVVRYQPTSEPTPPIEEEMEPQSGTSDQEEHPSVQPTNATLQQEESRRAVQIQNVFVNTLQRMPKFFRRQRTTPPPEVALALSRQHPGPNLLVDESQYHSSLLQRLHLKRSPKVAAMPRPAIVIPAPPCRRGSFNNSTDSLEDAVNNAASPTRKHLVSTSTSETRDADQPPRAVLNAMNASSAIYSNHHISSSVPPGETGTGTTGFPRTDGQSTSEEMRGPYQIPVTNQSPENLREQDGVPEETRVQNQSGHSRSDHDR